MYYQQKICLYFPKGSDTNTFKKVPCNARKQSITPSKTPSCENFHIHVACNHQSFKNSGIKKIEWYQIVIRLWMQHSKLRLLVLLDHSRHRSIILDEKQIELKNFLFPLLLFPFFSFLHTYYKPSLSLSLQNIWPSFLISDVRKVP